jgi:hypothetical protein
MRDKCDCGCTKLYTYNDYGVEYAYCSECLQAYDIDTGEPIPEGPEEICLYDEDTKGGEENELHHGE